MLGREFIPMSARLTDTVRIERMIILSVLVAIMWVTL
jgi:hypothetical protein